MKKLRTRKDFGEKTSSIYAALTQHMPTSEHEETRRFFLQSTTTRVTVLYIMSNFFDGKSLNQLKPFDMPDIGIARTFQNIELFGNATVLQNLLVGTNVRKSSNFLSEILFTRSVRKEEVTSRVMVEEVMDFLDLQQYREKYIMGLSYGTRKIVELGRALALKPKVLLLDEPASGLSAEETEDLAFWIEDIKKIMGITVLMVEHNLNLVNKVADRVAALVDLSLIHI